MNKKLFILLTTIFTVILLNIAGVTLTPILNKINIFSFENTKSDTINGITVKGDKTRYPVKFLKKIDGDTIIVSFNNQELTVRYLNVDTPETVKPNTPVEPFGNEASLTNENILKNADLVELEFDVKSKKDKYDRALAYVYADGILVQEYLLTEGLAEIKYVKEPDTRYLEIFKKAESKAKANKKNIWSN